MSTRVPPVPPANRSPKDPGSKPKVKPEEASPKERENFAQQGRQGNTKQNTTHPGYQQDR
jgi:hypothetical protein